MTHAEWREERRRAVSAPTGNLALIETRWGADDPDAALAGQPPTVTATRLTRRNQFGIEEHGIRLWDADSPAIRAFGGIDAYPYDPAWVLEGRFVEDARPVTFRHKLDSRDLPVPGDILLTLNGRDYRLSAFDDDGPLLLVFGDPTNGTETYESGRFLYVEPLSESGEQGGTDRVRLDFNRAFVPPCGFSEHYNCPLPPPQNRFAIPIPVGEKKPIFKDKS